MNDVREAAPLSTLIYRSRATRPMSPPDLLELTRAAQARNWSEAITGFVLWDKGDFFQLLEGPKEGIARVMRSINADTRHTNVEILTWQMTTRRRFADWDMKLGLGGGASTPWAREVVAPSPGSLAALRRHPQDAARIFDRLALKRFSPALEYVVYREVIPRLGRPGPAPCRGRQFANLLRSGDVESVLRFSRSLRLCRVGLLELTARLLGNDWMEDRCSEAEVTLAFCTLQTVLRLLDRPARVNGEWAGSALVTPQPGELHGLCASMSAHALRAEGWAVRCEFPANDSALTRLLKTNWFDLLDYRSALLLPDRTGSRRSRRLFAGRGRRRAILRSWWLSADVLSWRIEASSLRSGPTGWPAIRRMRASRPTRPSRPTRSSMSSRAARQCVPADRFISSGRFGELNEETAGKA